jgi:Sulfatase-modifying factor enzyme 1
MSESRSLTRAGKRRWKRSILAVFALAGCGQAKPMPIAPVPSPGPFSPAAPVVDAGAPEATLPLPGLDGGSSSEAGAQATECPHGMMLVDTNYCANIERRCIDEEYSPQNKITICHKYATAQRCLDEEQRRRFCIDEYEYPNQKGAHPPWMVSWYDAQATCESLGKRLCFESEWVSACEGPNKTPFPYGYARNNGKCNVDNTWIKPKLDALYGRDDVARQKELARLDQSMPAGALSECVSGFGVHDLTGNFDEWVTADKKHDDKSEWAALKGGAWGHVRNACRPVTTSHPPDFTYYFIAFRCCKDAPGAEAFTPKGPDNVPKVEPANRAPIPAPVDPTGPSSTKVAREYWPKPGK